MLLSSTELIMEINKKDFQKTYSEISDEELLNLYHSGTLMEIAHEALLEELIKRNILIPRKHETKATNSAVKSSKNLIKNIFVWVFIIICVLSIKIWVDMSNYPNRRERLYNGVDNAIQTINDKNSKEVEKEVAETLKETSISINKQLPMMVDPDTRLDAASSHGMQQHYKYTMINYSKDELNEQLFHDKIKAVISNSQCDNNDMKLMLNVGVEYFYHIFDKVGLHITTVRISKKDCK